MAKVFTSCIINASIDQVWKEIRDFSGIANWHSGVVSSEIENNEPSYKVGCVRKIINTQNNIIREELLALSDLDYFYSFSYIESPLPVKNYVSTLQIKPITDGNLTYAQWSCVFDCDPKDEENMIKLMGDGIYQAGFDSLKKIFSK